MKQILSALIGFATGAYATSGVAQTPPTGWSSWTSFGCSVTGDDLTNASDIMVQTGLSKVYTILHVDDCWMLHNRTDNGVGRQIPDPVRFPNGGMEAVISHIKEKNNMSFGIYTARGDHTCQGFAASCLHELVDAAYYASIGVDFLKDDSCSSCTGLPDDTEDDYRRMQMALDRVGGSISLAFEGQPDITVVYTGEFGNSRRVGHDITPSWLSAMTLVDIGSGLWPYAHNDTGSGSFWNWLDFIQVGRGDFVPTADPTDRGTIQARTHFSLFAAQKSLMFMGNVLPSMTQPTIDLVMQQDLMDANQDSLGIQARRVASFAPSNTTIVPDSSDGVVLLAKCNSSQPLQRWHYTASSNASYLQIAPCDANDPKQQFDGVSTGTFSHLKNRGSGECIDAATASGYQLGAKACDASSATQNWHLQVAGPVQHMQLGSTGHCLDIYDFHGPLVFDGSCKTGGDQDANQQFSYSSDTGLVRAAGGGQQHVPEGVCLSLQPVTGGLIWTENPEPTSDAPALCAHVESQWAGLVGCDPSQAEQDTGLLFVLEQSGGPAGGLGNYTLKSHASRNPYLAPNEQFGSSGPLPHTRWLLGGSPTEYTFDPSAPSGSSLHITATDIIDDDNVGHVTTGGSFCVEASRSGNLEVWAGPLAGGKYVVLLVNRAANEEQVAAKWSDLPSARAPTYEDRARAEGVGMVEDDAGAGLAGSGGFDAGSVFDVRDVWNGKDLGPQTGGYAARVPGHGVVALVLSPA